MNDVCPFKFGLLDTRPTSSLHVVHSSSNSTCCPPGLAAKHHRRATCNTTRQVTPYPHCVIKKALPFASLEYNVVIGCVLMFWSNSSLVPRWGPGGRLLRSREHHMTAGEQCDLANLANISAMKKNHLWFCLTFSRHVGAIKTPFHFTETDAPFLPGCPNGDGHFQSAQMNTPNFHRQVTTFRQCHFGRTAMKGPSQSDLHTGNAASSTSIWRPPHTAKHIGGLLTSLFWID